MKHDPPPIPTCISGLIAAVPGAGFLGKPFRHLDLARRVRTLLDGQEEGEP